MLFSYFVLIAFFCRRFTSAVAMLLDNNSPAAPTDKGIKNIVNILLADLVYGEKLPNPIVDAKIKTQTKTR